MLGGSLGTCFDAAVLRGRYLPPVVLVAPQHSAALVESQDGIHWGAPLIVLAPWEAMKVTGADVVREGDWYVMFYIGFADADHAQIGIARSREGLSDWQRYEGNPIIRRGPLFAWDSDAVYKPVALYDSGRWLVWFNGRRGSLEQIGLATHEGEALGF